MEIQFSFKYGETNKYLAYVVSDESVTDNLANLYTFAEGVLKEAATLLDTITHINAYDPPEDDEVLFNEAVKFDLETGKYYCHCGRDFSTISGLKHHQTVKHNGVE